MKAHMQPSPDHIFQAARIAYSGGHIEACRLGYHNKPVYHYDINSAYPDQIRRLPSLAGKAWVTGTGTPPAGFTLVRAVYSFRRGLPFYPLFHRSERGSILYPREGEGWYWYDEFCAGVTFAAKMGGTIDAIEWHHLDSSSNESPFQWVEDAYLLRQAIVADTRRTGVPNGAEKTIKLGLNSVAGKTAQQVGARMVDGEIVQSAYFQLEWAGAITAGCRAKLMLAALENPDAVISFATDAVFSTEPLDVYCPPEKILGAWERVEHEGITLVMPGVYWLHDKTTAKNPTGLTHYSRGIGKDIMSDVALIHEGWRARQTEIGFENESMVTLGAASMSENFWPLRGLFVTAKRKLKMNGHNSKRYPVALSQCAPHRELVRTWPQEVFDCDDGGPVMSSPFEIAWIADTDGDDAAEAELLNSSDAIEAAFFL